MQRKAVALVKWNLCESWRIKALRQSGTSRENVASRLLAFLFFGGVCVFRIDSFQPGFDNWAPGFIQTTRNTVESEIFKGSSQTLNHRPN